MEQPSIYSEFINQAEVAENELMNKQRYTNIHMLNHSSDFIMNNGCILVENDTFLRRESYTLNNSCKVKKDDEQKFQKNDCIGYECLKGSFLYDPDEHNTYHNYPVLQEEKHNGFDVFCTENHQVFHNLTRRSDVRPMPERHIEDSTILDSEKIPELTWYECKIDYPENKSCV